MITSGYYDISASTLPLDVIFSLKYTAQVLEKKVGKEKTL